HPSISRVRFFLRPTLSMRSCPHFGVLKSSHFLRLRRRATITEWLPIIPRTFLSLDLPPVHPLKRLLHPPLKHWTGLIPSCANGSWSASPLPQNRRNSA